MLPVLFSRLFRRKAAEERPVFASLFQQGSVSLSAVGYFRLATYEGRILTLRGARLSSAKMLDASQALVAVVPAAMPHACVLVAPDGRVFEIHSDSVEAVATSALIQQTDARGVVRLKYPIGPAAYLIAHSAEIDEDGPVIRFDGAGNTMDVVFAMLRVPGLDLPKATRVLGAEIGAAAAAGLRAEALLGLFAGGKVRLALAEALVRVMPRDEMAELGRLLLERADARDLLARAMPETDWLKLHLPALAEWCPKRETRLPERLRVTPEAEAVALYPVKGIGRVPTALALHGLARRSVLPRRLSCVLATTKNEGVYLLDWVAYHLSIGFEHVFLYSNDNQDGSDGLLEALDRAGVITWIRNARGVHLGAQEKAYAHALTMVPQILDYRWVAVIDLDEYFGFETGMFRDVADLIGFQETQSVDAIAVCWQVFAARVGEVWSEAFTPARLVMRAREPNEHVKTMFRPRLFWWSRPHNPLAVLDMPFEYRTELGELHYHAGVQGRAPAFAARPSAEHAWVNHYFVRTADEALWKWRRGRANWLNEADRGIFLEMIAEQFIGLAGRADLVEDRRLLACAIGQAEMKARLLAHAGVAEADAQIRGEFQAVLRRVRSDFLEMTPIDTETDAVRRFRDTLAGMAS